MSQEEQGVEIVEVPSSLVNLAVKRTSPVVRHWMYRGDFDFKGLIASVYLQGINDGFEACERRHGENPG